MPSSWQDWSISNNTFVCASRATHCRRVDETHPAREGPYQRLHPPVCQVRTAKPHLELRNFNYGVFADISVWFSDYSAVEFDQEKTSHILERTSPDVTSPESQLKRPGKADPSAGIKGARELTSLPSSSPDPPNHNLTWSIRQEVEKLMQDQNKYSSYTSSQAGRAKKQAVRQTLNFSLFQQLGCVVVSDT